MKLRTKIQVSFCVTIVLLLLIIGNIVIFQNEKAAMGIVDDSLITSANLASNHISQQLGDFMNVVELVGKDQVISSSRTAEKKVEYLDTFVKAYGFTSGNILDENGVSINDGTDFSDRDYVKTALAGTTNISDITLSKYTNTYGVSIAAPIYNAKNEICGVVYFRLDINFISDIIDQVKISENSYAYLVDKDSNVIVHPNQDLILNYNLSEQKGTMPKLAEEIAKGDAGNGNYKYEGKDILCGYGAIDNTNGWSIVIASPKSDFTRATNRVRNILVILIINAVIFTVIISAIIASGICRPINKVKDALVAVAEGDFSVKVERSTGKDEVAVLQNTTASLLDTLAGIIGQANRVLSSIARYDLTVENMNDYPGDFDSLTTSVNSIKYTLNQLIVEVQNAVINVDTGSKELAEATAALSQGTVIQAGSIQTLADDLTAVVEKINRNSENEETINKKLNNLDSQIHTANEQMQELLNAVGEIETMSSSIKKIVGTIDDIAFQTNILSLNASVEAARAGELGNGFAVVADEVRSLAEKCGESSRKTADLINQCIKYINNAKICADATFGSLSDVVANSTEIAQAFEQISADTSEQAAKSQGIQTEIHNISDVIQTNTATVEETAASTAVLSEQAANLGVMVQNFRVTR